MSPEESVNPSLIFHTALPAQGLAGIDVVIGGETEAIIVHRDGNRLAAWYNACPHQGRRLDYAPGRFLVDGDRLVCAAHGATFRLTDGVCIAGPCLGDRLRPLTATAVEAGWLLSDPAPDAGPTP